MGLKPLFRLVANNKDVTKHIASNLKSISFNDEDGLKSDKIDISVYGDFKRPEYKDELKLYLYYQEQSKEFYCGLFIVQNSTWNIDNSVTISATATNFSNSLKELKNRSFQKMSMTDIVTQIGSEQELKIKCDFDDVFYPYKAQSNESDIAFLGRMAKELNAVYSIKNETIIFLRQDEKSTLKTVTIDANNCDGLTIKNSNKTYYKSATCKYQDTKENKVETIEVGDKEPTYQMQETFTNKSNLEVQAKAKLTQLNKGVKSGSFKIDGFGIYARSNLKFLNIKQEDDVTYHIDTISHTLDDSGWNMSVTFSNSN
jgi:phage protein D